MLDDRPYMRQDTRRSRLSLTHWLMIINVVVFGLQEINTVYLGFQAEWYLALSPDGLKRGFLWQLVTFQFLHGGLLHLLCNVLGIYFFGRMVEDRLGAAGLLKVYLLSGMAGGLLQSALSALWPQHFGTGVLGASAGVYGLIAAATVLDPGCSILLWFFVPVRAKYFLIFLAGMSLFYVLVPNSRIAHGAHLGGIAGGLAYMRWGALVEDFFRNRRRQRPSFRPRELIRVRGNKPLPWQQDEAEDVPAEEFISREVDPILDKISAHGLQSLTPRERQILEAARNRMERR